MRVCETCNGRTAPPICAHCNGEGLVQSNGAPLTKELIQLVRGWTRRNKKEIYG